MIDLAKQAEEARRLLQVGQRGLAMVMSVRPTGEAVDDNPQAELELSVALAGREPYTVTHRQVISRVAIGSFWPGAKVPIRVDPQDPQNVLVAYVLGRTATPSGSARRARSAYRARSGRIAAGGSGMSFNVWRVVALTAVATAVICTPASAQQGGDYIASENVTLLKSIKPAGDGVGARVVGTLPVRDEHEGPRDLRHHDAEDPQLVGSLNVHVEFENEEVPTNGKLLGISGQTPTVTGQGVCPSVYPLSPSGCLVLYDVRDPAAPKQVSTILEAGDHTSTCVLDCSYFYGSAGSITDARGVLDGVQAKKIGNWQQSPTIPDFNGPDKPGKFVNGCHNLHEIRPGVLMAACQPFLLLSVRPEDGGTILQPKLLATGANADGRFIHGNHWPRAGADKIALVGGETNFKPQCGATNGAFATWDASHAMLDGTFSGPLDEYRAKNGAYLDSNPPAQILGCSVHWFEEHPTFHDGGLVALAAYENGTRFLQIGARRQDHRAGLLRAARRLDLGAALGARRLRRGVRGRLRARTRRAEVLRRSLRAGRVRAGQDRRDRRRPDAGSRGPGVQGERGLPARGGAGLPPRRSRAGEERAEVRGVAAYQAPVRGGSGTPGARPRSRATTRSRASPVARTRSPGRAGAADGWYVVRFRMPLKGGGSDVRRIAVRRAHGRFVKRPPSYLKDPCGALKSFKLQRPVFGGASRRGLKISYSLPRGVDSVRVVASAGGRVLKRFKGTGAEGGRNYWLLLPTRGIRRGTDVSVRLTIVRAPGRGSRRCWCRAGSETVAVCDWYGSRSSRRSGR